MSEPSFRNRIKSHFLIAESSCGTVRCMDATMTRAERKKLELRREIVDAAFDCFAEKGFHDSGIADIADRIGIGHGTVYRYFEGKRDLVERVIDDLLARLTSALAAAGSPDRAQSLEDYQEQSERIGTALAQLFDEDPRIPRLLLFHATGVDEELDARVLEFFTLATTLNVAYLEHGVDVGYLAADLDVDSTAWAINGMILGAFVREMAEPGRGTAARSSAAIRRLMFAGLTGS